MKRSTGVTSGCDAYPNTMYAQNTLYNNMSHHYRRIYNAKPCVDTSLPKAYKLMKDREKQVSNKFNCGLQKYFNRRPIKKPVKKDEMYFNEQTPSQSPQLRNVGKPKDVLDNIKHAPFQPRVLKTDAESKIRTLREYHPPRKKKLNSTPIEKKKALPQRQTTVSKNSGSENDKEHYGDYEDDRDWLQPGQQPQETRSSSKPSSSDSAYTEEGEGMWSGGESRDDSPQQMYPSKWSGQHWSDNRLYIKFLRAITDEVLRKGIYTNKALKKVFQEHIQKNKHILDVKRMQEEVEKLQEDLGIPKDDKLNDIDYGLGSGKNVNNSVEFKDYVDIYESVEQLTLNEVSPKTEDWFSNKINNSSASWNNQDSSDNIKLPLKLPNTDNDNDSSIGCEILSSCSGSQSIKSSKNSLGER